MIMLSSCTQKGGAFYAAHQTERNFRALPRKNEPVFITKNGYGGLAIMSMETYEALEASLAEEHPGRRTENVCYLTEQSPIWAGVLAGVLEQHGIPFIQESSLGAGLALKTGSLSETIRFFVPASHLAAAEALTEELFAKGLEDPSAEPPAPERERP